MHSMCVNTLQRRRARQRQGAARSRKFEGTEALARVKVFKHAQEEFVQQSVIGLGRGEERQSGIVFWLDAVSRTILVEVEQGACMKSELRCQ